MNIYEQGPITVSYFAWSWNCQLIRPKCTNVKIFLKIRWLHVFQKKELFQIVALSNSFWNFYSNINILNVAHLFGRHLSIPDPKRGILYCLTAIPPFFSLIKIGEDTRIDLFRSALCAYFAIFISLAYLNFSLSELPQDESIFSENSFSATLK